MTKKLFIILSFSLTLACTENSDTTLEASTPEQTVESASKVTQKIERPEVIEGDTTDIKLATSHIAPVEITLPVPGSNPLPKDSRVPGGIAIVAIGSAVGTPKPKATFEDRKVAVVENNNEWFAVVGIRLKAKPGNYTLKSGDKSLPVKIADKKYRTQELTVKPGQVNLSPENLARYQKEKFASIKPKRAGLILRACHLT